MTDIQLNLDPMRETIYNHLRGGICEVTFIKKDGSRRVLIGTLQPELLPEAPKKDEPLVEKEIQPAQLTDQIRVYDLEANAWRSFTLGNFIGIAPRYTGVVVE